MAREGEGQGAPVSAVEKALSVLEASVGAPRFSAVVAETGLPKATVHRILGELSGHGFIAPTDAGGFAPGPAFLSLAGRAFERLDISDIATPHVNALAADLECTVHLGVRNADELIYIARRDSTKPYRMPSRVGAAVALHSTAIGKAVLTGFDVEELRDYAARTGLRAETPRTITDLGALAADVRRASERGFSIEREENVPGVACLGVPITDHTGRVAYGISISTLAIEHTEAELEAMAPRVTRAAQAIESALGRTRISEAKEPPRVH